MVDQFKRKMKMHTINHPSERTYYIALDADGNINGYGYVDPDQRLDSGAAQFQIFPTEAAMSSALTALGGKPDYAEIDPNSSVEVKKIVMKAQVNNIRSEKLSLPISYMGYLFDTDDKSIANLTGTISFITATQAPLPEGFGWRTTDNITVPMNIQQLLGLAAVIFQRVNVYYNVSWSLKEAIDVSTYPETVDINAGWN